MSAESKLTRDKDGFLKCKACPRRFLTEIGFENHSSNQHQKVRETRLNQDQPSETKEDEGSSKKNTQSEEEERSLSNFSFGGQVGLNLHRSIEHQKTSKLSECKKLLGEEINFKKTLQNDHQLSFLHKCNECNRTFTRIITLKTHINLVHKGWRHYKCLLCNGLFASYLSLRVYTSIISLY